MQALSIRPGVGLTAEQAQALTSDVVLMETRVVDGQSVLVPVVYLAPGRALVASHGALIAAHDIRLTDLQGMTNGGSIQAANSLLLQGQALDSRGGSLISGGAMQLQAAGSIDLSGAQLSAGSLALEAGGDLILATQTQQITTRGSLGSRTTSVLGPQASIEVTGDATLQTGGNFVQQGASLSVGGKLATAIGGNWDLASTALASSTAYTAHGGQSSSQAVQQVGSALSVGGLSDLRVAQDFTATGATIDLAGGGSLQAGGNLTLQAATSSLAIDATGTSRSRGRSASTSLHIDDQTLTATQLTAGDSLAISAGKDLTVSGSSIDLARGTATLSAVGNLTLTSQSEQHAEAFEHNATRSGVIKRTATTEHTQTQSTLSTASRVTGDLVALVAGNDLGVQGSQISGTHGVLLSAGRNLVVVESHQTESQGSEHSRRTSGLAGSFMGTPVPGSVGNAGSTQTTTDRVVASAIASAQGSVRLTSLGTTALQGVQVTAAQGIAIDGAEVSASGALGSTEQHTVASSRGTNIAIGGWHDPGEGFNARQTDTTTGNGTQLTRSTLAAQSVSIAATGVNGASGNLTIAGTTVNADSLSLSAANALQLNVQTTTQASDHSSQGRDLAWQAMQGQGQSVETAQYNELNVATLSTDAKSVQVQVGMSASPSAETATTAPNPPTLQATAATLAAQPGMAWMAQLQSDPLLQDKVDWNALTLAHEGWDYKQQGLTQEGAAIVTLVVAYFTAGAASGVGTTAGNAAAVSVGEGVALSGGGTFVAATGTATTFSSVVAGAVTAGVSALAGQAAVSLINNQGNLGRTLDDLGSSDSIKGLVSAVITGGVLGGLSMMPTGGATPSGGASPYLTQLGQNLQAGAARAVINSAIYGTSLEDNLSQSIKAALIDTAAAQTANAIGDADLDTFANRVAHAVAGCAAGAATTGNAAGCSAGAIGAAVGEASAELYGRREDTVQFASLVSGIAAAVASQDVNVASAAGGNAAANNLLAHLSSIKEGCGLTGCSDAVNALVNGSNVGGVQTLSSGATMQVVRGTDGSIGAWVSSPGGDPVLMDAKAFSAFSQMPPAAQTSLLNSSQLQLTITNARLVTSDLLSAALSGLHSYGNTVSDSLTSLGDAAVAVGSAIARNGPFQITPQDLPPTDDGPPTAGGGTAVVTAGALVPVCIPPVCTVVPVAGTVTIPSGLTLSESNEDGNDSGSSSGTSSSSAETGSSVNGANGGVAVGAADGSAAVGEVLPVPGRVQSRINIANGATDTTPLRQTGNPVSAGFDHVVDGHFDVPVENNRSVFTVTPAELKGVLQSDTVVSSPVAAVGDGTFVRTVNVGRSIGTTSLNEGGVPTSTIKIFTDSAGNLITAFPVRGGK